MRYEIHLLVVLTLTPLWAEAEPRVNTRYSYYEIYPSSKYDLNREMSHKTPIRSGGKKFRGNTLWEVNWRFKWRKNNGQCVIDRVNTALNVTFTMPRLAEKIRSDHAITSPFRQYYQALFNHEKGHMQSGVNAAKEIENAVSALPPTQCQQIERRANQISNNIVRKYSELDKLYDRRTDHGRRQGVVLERFL